MRDALIVLLLLVLSVLLVREMLEWRRHEYCHQPGLTWAEQDSCCSAGNCP